MSTRKFSLGQTVITATAQAAIDALPDGRLRLLGFVLKHQSGDWGVVCDEDKIANDQALIDGERILSIYDVSPSLRVWIITEWDRSYTTVMLPEDY